MQTFDNYNPVVVSVYFFVSAGIAMFSMNPVILMLSLFGAMILYFIRNGRRNMRIHLFTSVLFLIMAFINPFVSHNGVTVLFVMNDNPVTLEAFIYGVVAAVMIVSVLYWFSSFSQLMTSDKLLYIFGALSPKLALILSMSLRYVPLFAAQYKKVKQTQRALGLYKDDNIADSFRGSLRVFSIMLTWALENGIITADSMTARGYGTGRRSQFSLFLFRRQDICFLILSIGLAAVTLWGIYKLEFVYYPAIAVPEMTPAGCAGYLAYASLVLLPAVIEVKEALKWKYLRSKI